MKIQVASSGMPSPSPSAVEEGEAQADPSPAPIGVSRVGSVSALRAASASSRATAPTEAVSSAGGPVFELPLESPQPARLQSMRAVAGTAARA